MARARVRRHPRPQRVRRDDRHEPDRRVGAPAFADRADVLARDRPGLRRHRPLADR